METDNFRYMSIQKVLLPKDKGVEGNKYDNMMNSKKAIGI